MHYCGSAVVLFHLMTWRCSESAGMIFDKLTIDELLRG
jgi:hypothetical protein